MNDESYKIPLVKDDSDKGTTLLYFWNPKTEDYETDGLNLRSADDWPHWQRFLELHKSFRYESGGGSFSAVLEQRRKPTGTKSYWYAHRRFGRQGKIILKRKYLGIAKNLSSAKLYKTAFELSQLELDLSQE